MTEHKLSEQDLQEIREEAEKLYPVCMMGTPDKAKLHGITHYDFNEDQRQAYIAALTRERERVKGLVEAQDEYIKLLTDELTDMAGMAYVHGWRSTRVEKGQELRDKISQFKL